MKQERRTKVHGDTEKATLLAAVNHAADTAVAKAVAVVEDGSVLLNRLLKMADGYQATNAPHQAAEMYFELIDCHPNTLEAIQARKGLIEISEGYERSGNLRQARSIYERLFKTAPLKRVNPSLNKAIGKA